MWDDFKIGNLSLSGSATRVSEYSEYLSENTISYWYSGKYISGRISKSTKEGKQIKKMIEDKTPKEKLDKYIFGIGLKHIKSQRILDIIKDVEKESFERGREHQAHKIRTTLNYGH